MKKKIIAGLIMSACMLAFAGCANNGGTSTSTTSATGATVAGTTVTDTDSSSVVDESVPDESVPLEEGEVLVQYGITNRILSEPTADGFVFTTEYDNGLFYEVISVNTVEGVFSDAQGSLQFTDESTITPVLTWFERTSGITYTVSEDDALVYTTPYTAESYAGYIAEDGSVEALYELYAGVLSSWQAEQENMAGVSYEAPVEEVNTAEAYIEE